MENDPSEAKPPPEKSGSTEPEPDNSAAGTSPWGARPKPTASELFNEVQGAVRGASRREPYGWFAGGTILFTAVWLLWYENDKFGFWGLKLWSVFIVLACALVLAPIVRKQFNLSDERAAQLALGGACGMAFAWVAFLLPNIQSNQAFFGTLATACAGLAAWMSPGRTPPPPAA